MKRTIILIVLLLLAGLAYYAWHEYTRKPATAADLETHFRLTAEELMNGYSNEDEGNKKYNSKVIEVTGIVYEVIPNEKNTDILLETSDPLTGVNVQLIPEEGEKAKSLKPGQEVTLKGICNGKLTDIELNKGIILK